MATAVPGTVTVVVATAVPGTVTVVGPTAAVGAITVVAISRARKRSKDLASRLAGLDQLV
ncbi:hypothetical protein ASD66_11460 [Nocardioides sp. Root151]|nr:hypothetical protein ASD66_11460 [Nocardioides sp. Root151]